MMYASLTQPWQVCFDLAWEACKAGSLPIGAVITDSNGKIVATGRNRIAEPEKSYPSISGHALAHAEVNAMLNLDETQVNPRTCTLYTTTEPCPFCMGAIRMTGIPKAYFACRDPWAGCSLMTEVVPYIKAKNMQVAFLGHQTLETVLAAMLLESDSHRSMSGAFFEAWLKLLPKATTLAQYLVITQTLRDLKTQQASPHEVLETLESFAMNS
jgi:tRNA(adenine34) deaminase